MHIIIFREFRLKYIHNKDISIKK